MKRRIMKLGMACGAIVLSTVLCFAGCASGGEVQDTATPEATEVASESSTPEPSEESTQTLEPRSEPSYVTFGQESPDAYAVVLTNGTGQVITGIKVRNSDQSEFGSNMIPSGMTVSEDETFRLTIPKDSAAGVAASDAPEEASVEVGTVDDTDQRNIAFNETYDIQLTFADGKEATLYDLGLMDIDTALVAYSAEEDVAYISYVSTATNETVSTLDAQIARSRDEAAAALEEENTRAETEAPAATKSTSISKNDADVTGGGTTSTGGGISETPEDDGNAAVEEEPAGDGGGYEEPEYVETEPEQVVGECIEDNIVWND